MNNFYQFKNKKVIITGHTGFKGSWLLSWMLKNNAKILGISKDIPSNPSHFKLIKKLKRNKFIDKRININNKKKLEKTIINFSPDFIFHLAAQSIVTKSVKNPELTWNSNLFGTMNILEISRKIKKKCVIILVTSDKCYENFEISKGYKENDRLGGEDPYSASKASIEILFSSYYRTYLKYNKHIRIATARAGNVIGGGDWSNNRIIPDCIRAWQKNKKVIIRNPNSTRPWQHVLEPLRGYMELALKLNKNKYLNGNAFNFGPKPNYSTKKVIEVVKIIKKYLPDFKWKLKNSSKIKEQRLLSLNCRKAKLFLKWETILSSNESISFTIDWYNMYYSKKESNTFNQINLYEKKLKQKN